MILQPNDSPHKAPGADDFAAAHKAWNDLVAQAQATGHLPSADRTEWVNGYATAHATYFAQRSGNAWRMAPEGSPTWFRVGYGAFMKSVNEG